ncbi:MAG: DUF89 family protein [Candidatus Omnitrophica bacterium]|nr:DUF89 family protein [Candidatus Omnitrophota bacterium]MBU1926005.1 DUF89 family protein [Candidatus Omnitrophota bacterium]MBU2063015.1 DUF89 family protein [Candidatus Omnitrophota bacterium]
MRAQKECYNCLKKLTLQTIRLAKHNSKAASFDEEKITKNTLRYLADHFNAATIPAQIFSRVNRKIKKLSSVADAFNKRKSCEMVLAKKTATRLRKTIPSDLKGLLTFSAAGNCLDFFKPLHVSAKELAGSIDFTIDKGEDFKKRISCSKRILFFADNTGECFFDLPLIQFLSKKTKVVYIVKSKPVQNDLTINDLKISGILKKFPLVLASGNDAVGIELSTLSGRIKKELQACDLILAKGMGYYETFSELSAYRDKVFYLLMAKCRPVAKSLGVPLNSYVFTQK